MLKKAYLEAPVLAFIDFNKPLLLETDTSKLGLGVLLSQKQPDWWYQPVAYASWSLTIHEHNYLSTKQDFLALKWAIAKQFQEYLCWKLVWKLKITLLPTFWLLPIWMPPSIVGWSHWQDSHLASNIKKRQCCCRCSDSCCIKAECWGCEVHPGYHHHRNCWKGWCQWPNVGWGWQKDT